MTTISFQLSEGRHTIRVSKAGYDTLIAEINVGKNSVSCVSVNGVIPGRCGQSTAPGVVTSGWNVTVYLKTATSPSTDVCSWITSLGGWKNIQWSRDVLGIYYAFTDPTNNKIGFTPVWNDVLTTYAYFRDKTTGTPDEGNATQNGCGFT